MVDAIVAGHLCLDIIPDLSALVPGQFDGAFRPGRLVQSGPATLATGGAVSNTGLALHRLGLKTRLIARVGQDQLGQALRQTIDAQGAGLAEGLIPCAESSTSYSIVISPPGSDRRFLHHPGANDDFSAQDVTDEALQDARLFHFGYPPLMARMYADNGQQLLELLRRVKACGLTTSLDMAYPDPDSPAGRADWPGILRQVLPCTDVFVPSLDEISYMLWRKTDVAPSAELLARVSGELLGMGAKMALLKLGDRGLYLRTASRSVLKDLGAAAPGNIDEWADFEAWRPCFRVNVVGTTGSGDVTVAGFLAALLRGLPPGEALTAALAVGACCVEAADALSGLHSWEATWQRIRAGWASHPERGK
ncbi:MAG: carbohydrate kinase family protein [Thermoflexales bacterium]|nr:carbohydrate kinase family protein [Thermoflexales bacterium]